MNLVVVPVYNEEETVGGVLEEIRRHHDGDILAIDDGSTDGSRRIISDFEGIAILRRHRNLGYGRSIIDGLRHAEEYGYEKVATIDCDEQHEPALIPVMFEKLGGLDVLSGSRYLTPESKMSEPPPDRRRVNMAVTRIINGITGYNLTDSFCGFKVYRARKLRRLRLDEPGYAQPLQFWIQAWRFGLEVGEMPVPLIYKNLDRSFGVTLDDPELRLMYYKRVIERELSRWSTSSSSARTRTI
ncbi:MAG: glycosyltransferase family 2 protein [Candidatus Nitrospinota bacterium M3_3B_026]